jgi:hypothetical protein
VAIAWLCGCESGIELEYHGRQELAEGRYYVLDLLADGPRAYALALDEDRERALTILPLRGTACSVGQVAAYVAMQSSRGLRIATFDAAEGPRRMQVVDARCEPKLEPLDDVIDLRAHDGKVLVTTAAGSLYALDPWGGSTRLVSDSVSRRGSAVRLPGAPLGTPRPLWLLEGDRLVLRDLEGRELDRAGNQVTELAVGRLGAGMIFSDAEGLHHADESGRIERLGDGGCTLRYATLVRGDRPVDLALLRSPCESGRLVAIDPEGELEVLAEHVLSYFPRLFVTRDERVESWLAYVTQQGEGAPQRHFLAPLGGDAIELDVPLGTRSALVPLDLEDGVVRGFLVTTAEEEPRFGWLDERGAFRLLAERVRALALTVAGVVVLHDYDEDRGTLSRLLPNEQLGPLAQDVPVEGLLSSPFQATQSEDLSVEDTAGLSIASLPSVHALLHDYDGSTGTLSEIAPSRELLELARGVPAWSPQAYLTAVRGESLIEPAEAIAVLTFLHDYDSDAGSGTLSVRAPNGQVTVAERVTSHVASSDPSRHGVLFATSGPGAPTVWFVQQ